MIRSHWNKILLLMALGAVAAYIASKFMAEKYEALVEIMVEQTPVAQPYYSNSQQLSTVDSLNASRPRGIVTQVEQLQSIGVLETAAKKVAAANSLPDPTNDPSSELNPDNLQRAISISADSNSDIISFRVRMTKPEMAKDVAREVYLAFVDQNTTNAKSLAGRAITSLKSETANIEAQLKTLDTETSALRTKTGLPDVNSQVQSEVNGLTQLQQAAATAAIDASGAHQQVQSLEADLAKIPKYVDQGSITSMNPAWEQLQRELATARSERESLLQRYLPENDQVKAFDARIRSIQSQLRDIQTQVPSSTNRGLNQNYLTLQSQLATAHAAAVSADARKAEAQSKVAERENYLKTIPAIQIQLMALDRRRQSLEKVYYGVQDQLKTLEAAQQGRTSPTQEVTPPHVFPDPVSPKTNVNTVFGALIGLIFGVLAMLYTEGRRQPVRSLAQLNSLALKPVYRLIPELRQPFRGLQKAPPEPFESLLGNFLRSEVRPYRIASVGVNKDSGASTTALNLSIAASRHGARVLLVQCEPKGALSKAGVKEIPEEGKVISINALVEGMASETVLSNAEHEAGILSSITSRESDLTIFDLEPATRSAEYAFVAPYVDEVVLLVRAGGARSVEFLQVQQALRDAGCPRVTVVFTRTSDFSVVADAVDVDVEEETPWTERIAVLPARTIRRSHPDPKPIAASSRAEKEAAETIGSASAADPASPEVTNGSVGHEEQQTKGRATPSVTIEDFGGISRSKPSEDDDGSKSPRKRGSKIDTSDIDS